MHILGTKVWPPDVMLDVHAVYTYFQMKEYQEQEELKEIIFLMGTGLFETACIRYIAVKKNLFAKAETGGVCFDIITAQYALERVIDD